MERKSILAVLVYVFFEPRSESASPSAASREILLIHRNTRDLTKDDHSGKWNGLGGKGEPDESLLQAAQRELQEESGLRVSTDRFQFLGFLQFPLFKPQKNEDWNVGVFAVDATREERDQPLVDCSEGTLHWKKVSEISSLAFWPGDEAFLPSVIQRKSFYGVIRYESGVFRCAEVLPI
jgi:8-oxo-dGTP diphosphatase